MENDEARARRWIDLLAREPRVPFGETLRTHYEAGRVSWLCDCGCNSFDVDIPRTAELPPLAAPGPPRTIFEIRYEWAAPEDIRVLIFVDTRGYLSGVNVTCGQTSGPIPDDAEIGDAVYASERPETSHSRTSREAVSQE